MPMALTTMSKPWMQQLRETETAAERERRDTERHRDRHRDRHSTERQTKRDRLRETAQRAKQRESDTHRERVTGNPLPVVVSIELA